MKNLITVENLNVKFGNFIALDNISVSIGEKCNVVGLIGPNGAGKTTLIHSIMGICKNAKGKINFQTQDITYCPDTPSFEFYFTANEVMEHSLALSQLEIDKQKIKKYLRLVGLEFVGNKLVGNFSRGMKQRLGIASVLVLEPNLVFLDEPTSAIDPLGRDEIIELIKNVSKNITVVVSSHNLGDIEKIAENLIVLNKGNLIYKGKIANFLNQYDPYSKITVYDRDSLFMIANYLKNNNMLIDLSESKECIIKIAAEDFDKAFEKTAKMSNLVKSIQRNVYSLDEAFKMAIKKNEQGDNHDKVN